uniref:SMYD family member 5 n=1 Tax=Ficedula albicollis TaxID=59894 RepID=A0A803WC29_FICAL
MAAAGGPHAGAAAEARFISSAKGKGLFATKNIRKGETVFVERPVVSSQFLWNALYNYRACDHCLRALETAEENAQRLLGQSSLVLPHPEQCSTRKELHQQCPRCQVTYCSAECRQAALEQYHQVLCLGPSRDDPTHPLNKLQEAWRNMHYPPETSSIMLMARMVATIKQAKDKEWWIKAFSQFCSKTANEEEEIVHKLLGDKFKWFTPEGFRSLFALVGTNGQGIGTSSLSQWVHACDALDLPLLQREELDAFIDQLYKDIEKGEALGVQGRTGSLSESWAQGSLSSMLSQGEGKALGKPPCSTQPQSNAVGVLCSWTFLGAGVCKSWDGACRALTPLSVLQSQESSSTARDQDSTCCRAAVSNTGTGGREMSCARLAHFFLQRKGFVLAMGGMGWDGMGWDGYDGYCSLSVPWTHVMWLWCGSRSHLGI